MKKLMIILSALLLAAPSFASGVLLPGPATPTVPGVVKPDGSTITVNNGTISVPLVNSGPIYTYVEGLANSVMSSLVPITTLGSGLSLSGGTLANTGVLSFNTRSGAVTLTGSDVTVALGFTPEAAFTIGSGLSLLANVLTNTNPTPYSLPTASASVLGGIKIGSGLSIGAGVLSTVNNGTVQKLAATLGAVTAGTAVTVTNTLGTADCSVTVIALVASTGNFAANQIVYPTVLVTSGTISITFAQSYSASSFRVIVEG